MSIGRSFAEALQKGLRSMEAVVQRLIEIDQKMQQSGEPADKPLLAWGFDPIYFGGERMTVEHLDRASSTRPNHWWALA